MSRLIEFSRRCDWVIVRLAFIGAAYLGLSASIAHSQVMVRVGPPKVIDAATQSEIIDSVTAALNDAYVFPKVAGEMEKLVRKQYKDKAYKDLTDLFAFTQQLTKDLRSISNDRHLGVTYIPSDAPEFKPTDSVTDADRKRRADNLAAANYEFEKVEHLPANIGYLKFNQFVGAELAGPTAIAAMNFLGHSDALIIDLRDNGGGDPSLIQLISSYFFDQPVHLNSFYFRKTDSVQQFWTSAYVAGPRLAKADIYVLTSSNTFSGAEEFSYNLKNLKRATIVGETTGGGAHPVEDRVFRNLNVILRVPYGRAVNPITGTNWEGIGVKPDIEVPRDKAFDVAYARALKGLLEKTTDPDKKGALVWISEGREAILNPVKVDIETLKQYAGSYGPRVITLENGDLYYQREGRPKFRLIPMTTDKFMLDGLDSFRIQFVRDSGGNVTELVGMYDIGQSDRNARTR
jgi:hypothetical protein